VCEQHSEVVEPQLVATDDPVNADVASYRVSAIVAGLELGSG
jgi:hypothetical protein